MSDNREDLLRRIRALQKRTVENGCTEAEAMTAASLAAKMIDQYGFAQSDVQAKTDPVAEDVYIARSRTLNEIYYVVNAAAEYCDCEALLSKHYIDKVTKRVILVIGKEPDRAMMHYLLDLVTTAYRYEWKRFVRVNGDNSRQAKKAFGAGMGRRISERLRQMKKERNSYVDPASGRSGQALVLVKNALVVDKMKELHPQMRTVKRSVTGGARAYMAGHDAGGKVQLNTGIGANKSNSQQIR